MVFHRVFSAAVLSVLFLVLVPLRADAQVVTSTANSGTGSLRDTIAAAAPGSVITFAPALTAGGPVTITLTTGQLNIAKGLTINGPGAGLLTISGNNTSRVFNITAGDFALSGLTIADAWTSNPFGGSVSFNGTGSLTITECRIVNNVVTGTTALGGGLYVRTSGPVAITDTTVSGNSATATFNGQGGGIFIEDPNVSGGANVTIANSTISGNTVSGGTFGLGGGITFSTSGTLLLSNTTVTGNSATATTYAGGGGVSSDGTVTAVNATIAGNTVTGTSGSNFKAFGGIQSWRLTLRQTIVAGNTLVSGPPGSAPDLQAVVTSQGFNLIGIADGTTGLVASDLRGTAAAPLDPWLAALADNGGFTQTMALLPGSPAIDAGDPAYPIAPLTGDQRSFGRVYNNRVDIGAFEYGAFGAVTRPASAFDPSGSATLNGTVYPGYLSADVTFRFGTDPTLMVGTDTASIPVDAGTNAVPVAVALTGLDLGTDYYYQLVLTNAEGRFEGRILSFFFGGRMSVEQPTWTPLTDGVSAVAFGIVGTMSGGAARTFTIRNTGQFALTGLSLSVDGVDAGDFTAGALPAATLAAGASTSFAVTFRPGAAGARSAVLHIDSDPSGDASTFDVALSGTGKAPIIWTGAPITFTKPDYSSTADVLTPSVTLARGNNQGLFNRALEPYYDYNYEELSPEDTEWAFGTTSNLANLTFQPWLDWHGWCPPCALNRDAVLHLISEDIYIDIRFTSWTEGNRGGGFSYVRSTPGGVVDTTAPVISGVPTNLTVEATGSDGATVSWVAPTAQDAVDGVVPVSCTPASSSTFALGTTPVTCRATDAAGNTAEATFTVTVVDTTAPAIVYSGNAGTYQISDIVSITCMATDAVGVTSSTCATISGPATSFQVGTNTVTSTATDAAGNTTTVSVTFTVVVTSTGLQDLIAQIAGSSAGQLINALQNVTTAPNANARAGRVTAFKNQVNAQVNSGKITAAQGALLTTLIDLMP